MKGPWAINVDFAEYTCRLCGEPVISAEDAGEMPREVMGHAVVLVNGLVSEVCSAIEMSSAVREFT